MKKGYVVTLVLAAMFAFGCSSGEKEDSKVENNNREVAKMSEPTASAYLNMPFETIAGEPSSLAAFEGKVLLLVNVASKCGYTRQYASLEELYRTYKEKGLVVIGFPANNFGGQEPGTDAEILSFCQSEYDVTFPMMSKISVLGEDKHPLFAYLTEESALKGDIEWNFSKFLIGRDGSLVARYGTKVELDDQGLIDEIGKLL